MTSNEGDIDEVSTLEYNYTGLSNVIDVWNDTLSTLTLELNYNPYNMGHKITKTHHSIGYEERYPNPDN